MWRRAPRFSRLSVPSATTPTRSVLRPCRVLKRRWPEWTLAPPRGLSTGACIDAQAAPGSSRDENAFRRLRVLAAGADRLRVLFLQGGKNGQGPNLWGLIGRSSGSVDGFAYSAANKNSGITWSAKHLEVYLQDPKKVTPQPRSALVLSCGSVVCGSHGTQEAFMAGRGSNRRCCEDPTPYSHQE